jgi:hypothetical protein
MRQLIGRVVALPGPRSWSSAIERYWRPDERPSPPGGRRLTLGQASSASGMLRFPLARRPPASPVPLAADLLLVLLGRSTTLPPPSVHRFGWHRPGSASRAVHELARRDTTRRVARGDTGLGLRAIGVRSDNALQTAVSADPALASSVRRFATATGDSPGVQAILPASGGGGIRTLEGPRRPLTVFETATLSGRVAERCECFGPAAPRAAGHCHLFARFLLRSATDQRGDLPRVALRGQAVFPLLRQVAESC